MRDAKCGYRTQSKVDERVRCANVCERARSGAKNFFFEWVQDAILSFEGEEGHNALEVAMYLSKYFFILRREYWYHW